MSPPTTDANSDAAGIDADSSQPIENGDSDAVNAAIDAFRAGQPVLIHDFDDREGETDIG